MTAKDIDYNQIEDWIIAYNNCQNEKSKKQILTLIFVACKPVVRKLSYGLARRSSDPIEDIIQVGNIGLLKAVQRYKSEYKNVKTYINYSIIGEIKHYLRDKTQSVKVPRVILELSYRINKLSMEMIEKAGQNYDKDFLAKELNISKERLNEILEIDRRKPISLDQIQFINDENQKTVENFIDDESFDAQININENKILLKEAISKLPDKLQNVIKKIYFEGIYQEDLAKQMNTSQSNVSRMQKRALKKLFEIITDATNRNEE